MDDIQELYYLFPDIKEHIRVEKKVGQGTFSFVYMGHFVDNEEEKLALKYIIPTSSPSRTKQEIECLLNIGWPENVIGVHAVLRNKSHILILMPYVNHVAFHDSFVHWDVNEIRDYVKNLLVAMNRVHKCGIIHRDVKPSNFLYDNKKKTYALVDFGLAQCYDKDEDELEIFNENSMTNKSRSTQQQNNENSVPQSSKHNLINIKAASHIKCPTYQNSSPVSTKINTNNSSQIISVQKAKNPVQTTTAALNKSSTPNLQKYYSFQKSSFNYADNKCTCFNMPFVCEICTNRNSKWAPRAGTAGFRAPEVLFRSTHQTPAVDIWSIGIIFLCLLTGRYPFFKAVDDVMAIMQMVSLFGYETVRRVANKYGESLVCSNDFDKANDLRDTCKQLRKRTHQKSMMMQMANKSMDLNSSGELKSSSIEFPDSAYDLLKRLLELDCDKRISAEDALNHSFFNCY